MQGFRDVDVVEFLEFGWPIGFVEGSSVNSSLYNHQGARDYGQDIVDYLKVEVEHSHVLGPFKSNPFSCEFVRSPLNTVPKKDSEERRVILDLSCPRGFSVNDGVPADSYLGVAFRLHFPSVDALVDIVKEKGLGCLMFKRDLKKAYRQIPVDPGDVHLLGYGWKGHILCDRVLPMRQRRKFNPWWVS